MKAISDFSPTACGPLRTGFIIALPGYRALRVHCELRERHHPQFIIHHSKGTDTPIFQKYNLILVESGTVKKNESKLSINN